MSKISNAPVLAQPAMNLYEHSDEKNSSCDPHQCDRCEQWSQCNDEHGHSSHRGCHGARLRRIVLPALVAFLVLSLIAALACTYGTGDLWGLMGVDELARRADGDPNNGGVFVNNKLYLIVIFVGLLLVIILAIMLSAWCCKGAFQNPLCCPCYLCACCGGLACLECIGCGLCAEGLSEM